MGRVAAVTIMGRAMGTTIIEVSRRIWHLYYDGFRSLTLGRTLWKLIALKLLIMFGVFKLFFFNGTLHTEYESDAQRGEHVSRELLKDMK